MPTINNLTTITNNVGESIGNSVSDAFDTMRNTLNSVGDFVTFGSNDRRQGYLGLFLGPIYDTIWKNLSVVITSMLGMEIGDYCNFNDRMYGYMTRLMLINLWEHNTTLAMLCESGSNQANANSRTITHESQMPPYTKGNNYLENVRNIIANEANGEHATSSDIMLPNNPEGPYYRTVNRFPDENGTLRSGDYTWSVSDPNSILTKTKCLFRQRKIKSLISRFGTNADGEPDNTRIPEEGSARTKFGLSRGHNLLTKEAEDNFLSYDKNGYNNPYCRVWTHHYKYDQYNKAMRSFEGDVSEVNNWTGDKWKRKDEGGKELNDGWREGGKNSRWNKSVLNNHSDGLINITPHFNGGGDTNIHSKDCMFSIENLAWKDYDPYSFEEALSWEQRGPLGGRIMWFPPYGLTFNETSQAQWNSNTFIGRGEDVYTYVNTKRSGTLQFYLIVDHPSILDYVSWYEANRDHVKDTDILRYFAGCDDSLKEYAQPTPMTDEGKRGNKLGETVKDYTIKDEEKPSSKVETVEFFTYFPNNYSGMFDIADKEKGGNGLSADFVIKYLLAGTNAQENTKINEQGKPERIFSDIVDYDKMNGNGYEMTNVNGISSVEEEHGSSTYFGIVGNKYPWTKTNKLKDYSPDLNKIWRYRIDGTYNKDGDYKEPGTDNTANLNNIYSNTYAQTLSNYKDTKSFQLNTSLKKQTENYGGTLPETAYTFTEVVEAVARISGRNATILNFFMKKSQINDSDRVEKLKEIFKGNGKNKKTNLESITIEGWSNSHGSNANSETNKKRNEVLAKGRAKTVERWLCESMQDFGWNEVKPTINTEGNKKVGSSDENSLEAKLFRAVKCTLKFKEDDTDKATQTDENGETTQQTFQKVEGRKFAGRDVYRLTTGDTNSEWVKLDSGEMAKILRDQNIVDYADEQFWLDVMNGGSWQNGVKKGMDNARSDTLYNNIRYDQEYHFFRRVQEETPLIYEKLLDKVKFFDPAFHSMTPEGFNARCTFLNQCTRQGDTVGVSDKNRLSASNMAFGRPPYCVLRLGDFYNQLIIINNVNIQYDTSNGVVWDLNDEGVGVQPMLAQVSLDFTFIGGGSLDGPVRRLQNAMSFSYYANTELYDNRSDRPEYDYDRSLTMGGGGKGNMVLDKSSFNNVAIYNPEALN